MKLCPNCRMMVETADTCPYCKTALSDADEKAFRKDYILDFVKISWFSIVCVLLATVFSLAFGELMANVSVHMLSFAGISCLLAFLQFRGFGKYSRRFHTSSFWRIATISVKYFCASVTIFIAAIAVVVMLTK